MQKAAELLSPHLEAIFGGNVCWPKFKFECIDRNILSEQHFDSQELLDLCNLEQIDVDHLENL